MLVGTTTREAFSIKSTVKDLYISLHKCRATLLKSTAIGRSPTVNLVLCFMTVDDNEYCCVLTDKLTVGLYSVLSAAGSICVMCICTYIYIYISYMHI